jgi:hypothetical protein
VTASVAGGEFDGWDDPNLDIALTQVAEKITISVDAFMAYLELYRDPDEELPQQDAAVASPKSAVSRLEE